MRVLVVGARGGREHAIAWACEQHGHNVSIATELGNVTTADIDLVIPGPESVLANGITDEYPVMRHLCNLETVKTYEGTDHIHTLVIGERVTGVAAYK